ncbi:hypothetical protein D3C80_1073390 [compost metagenome]
MNRVQIILRKGILVTSVAITHIQISQVLTDLRTGSEVVTVSTGLKHFQNVLCILDQPNRSRDILVSVLRSRPGNLFLMNNSLRSIVE